MDRAENASEGMGETWMGRGESGHGDAETQRHGDEVQGWWEEARRHGGTKGTRTADPAHLATLRWDPLGLGLARDQLKSSRGLDGKRAVSARRDGTGRRGW